MSDGKLRSTTTQSLFPSRTRQDRNDLDEDREDFGVKFESKDNWKVDSLMTKFKFKGGEIVSESEIGVKNSSITMFDVNNFFTQLSKFVLWVSWLNFSRLNLYYVIVELVIYALIGKYYITKAYICYLIGTYLFIIAFETCSFFYFYFKVKKMEDIWDKSSIHKIKKSSSSWVNVQFRTLKVGDLIYLKHGTVAPADILIIDTSDTHFSEQILSSNERRVTGCNKLTIKRAIKNLRNKTVIRNPHECIKYLLPLLEGQMEYEPPSERVVHFSGIFKLNNDPQVSKITHKNMIFCGTQLQTSWMIGIVMFTGQQTKIMQMNLLRWTAFQRFRKETKVGQISKVINWILLLFIGVGIMITLLYVVQISFESVEKETSMLIEEFYVGSKFQRFFKVLMIWHSTLMYVPHLIVLVYEFTGFFFGISIQRTQKLEIAEKVEAATLAIASTTQFQGRRSYKKKSTRNKSSETLEPRGSAITQGSSVNTPDPVRTGIGGQRFRRGRGEITGNSGHRGFKATGLSNTSQKRSLKSDVSTDSASASEMRHIKVINYEALPDLGKVNHVVFDKTDTLTLSTMHVCQIATCTNVYTVEGEAKLKDLMDLFTTNADLFEFEEDEEAKRLKENSFYSEKSQEYEKEINGEYVPKVVLEDSIDYLNIHGNMPEYNLGERGDTLREMDTGRDESIEVRSREHSLRSIPHRAPLSHKSSIYIGPLSVLQDNKQTFQLPQTKNLFKEDESFIELNLLEKQFKKHWGLVEQALPRSDESSLDVLINLRNGYSIKVNNEKYLQDKHLVADVRKREEQVEELLSYLYVMHLVEYGPHHHEERYLRPEDEAIFEIIKTLGFDQSKIYKSNDNNYLHSDHGPKKMYAFDIKNIGGLKAQAKIYAMNIFSQKRRRKSMIINGLNETEPFQLIAVGSEKTMKRVLRPARNSKEENLLKMLIAKQKQKGLKVVIIAKKALTEDEVFSYTKEYVKISYSARDQIEDLENLAVQMELDMDFVGCLGLRDSLHEEAVELAKHLSMSKMRMSIMSGDELENCMTVVQKLQISQIDIQNSSSFYWIRLSTAKGIMQEMRRIFDVLYDTLQLESYATIETILKPDKDPPKLISHTSSRVARMETKEEEFFHKEEETKVEELCADEIAANLKKTLLISGESIEIIMNTENLKRHLLAILPASHSVISYDMRPKHKAFLIDLMRSSGDVILAVGDGFNDIGMLARANIGVQLSNENVPLIFGDIVIPNLKHISSLLYVHGFNLKKNMFYVYTAVVNISTSVMFYPIITSFFFNHTISIRLQLEHLYFLTTFYFIATVFGLVNTSYSKDLLLMLPALYLENRIISENSISIYLISFIWAILESVVAFIPNVLFIGGDLSHEGIRSSPEVMNFFYYVTIMCSVAVKVIILLVRRTWSGVFKVAFTSLLVFGIFFLIILNPSFDDALVSGGLGNSLLVFLFSQIIVQCFINFYSAFVIESFKRFYFHRAAHFLRKLSQEPHPSKDKNERVLKYLQKFIKVADDVYLTIIKQMKRPFKDLNYMDNSLKSIVNIDFHNSNMGLGRIANTIVDSDERKKFLIYMSKTTNQPSLRILLIFLLLMGAAEWTIPLFTQTYKTPLLLGTVVPYFCLAIVILLFIQWLFPKFIHRAIIWAFIILTFVSAGLNFIPNRVFVSSLILLKRFMSSIHFRVPIAYRYTFNILFELIYFINLGVRISQSQEFFVDGNKRQYEEFWVKLFLSNFLILILRLISIRKNDRILKINFLNIIRIKNETSISKDKMLMLMPPFIIERLNNFEISKNFLTDDAGEIAVLFCDICEFDEVIKECESSVVEIMDDVFRNFDEFCKNNGIQKIETVGKTYMAAGGLKFIESKIEYDVNTKHFVMRTIDVAKKMLEFTHRYNYQPGKHLKAKIGIHYGSCIFGVLGYHKPQFSLIGDTINTTSRVCTTGNPETIILSTEAYNKVRDIEEQVKKALKKKKDSFDKLLFNKQTVYMKGKNNLDVYVLNIKGEKEDPQAIFRINVKRSSIVPTDDLDDLRTGIGRNLYSRGNRKSTQANKLMVPGAMSDPNGNNSTSREIQNLVLDVLDEEVENGGSKSKVSEDKGSALVSVPKLDLPSRPETSMRDMPFSSERMMIMPRKSEDDKPTLNDNPLQHQQTMSSPLKLNKKLNFFNSNRLNLNPRKTRNSDMEGQGTPQARRRSMRGIELLHSINGIESKQTQPPQDSSYIGSNRFITGASLSKDGTDYKSKVPMITIEPMAEKITEPLMTGRSDAPLLTDRPNLTVRGELGSKDDKIAKGSNRELMLPGENITSIRSINKLHRKSAFTEMIEFQKKISERMPSSPPIPSPKIEIKPLKPEDSPAPFETKASPSRYAQAGSSRNVGVKGRQPEKESTSLNSNPLLRKKSIRDDANTVTSFNRIFSNDDLAFDDEDSNDSGKNSSGDELLDLDKQDKNVVVQTKRSKKLYDEFKRKNKIRYSSMADFCLCLVILDILLSEIYVFFDGMQFKILSDNIRMVNYLIIICLVTMVVIRASKGNIWVYKSFILLLLVLRVAIDLFEVIMNHYATTENESEENKAQISIHMKGVNATVMVQTIFFLASGLFYPLESLLINFGFFIAVFITQMLFNRSLLVVYDIFELFIFIAFNIAETYAHHKFEFESFHNIMAANKMSIQYTQFVNRLLPKHIQQSSVLGNKSEVYTDVTILFADICGFTKYSADKASRQVVEMLSRLFTEFDMECNRLNLFKLYTIGDCYVVMGFIDKKNRKSPAEEANDVVQLAISMISIISKVRKMIKFDELNMRIGIHTGSKVYGGLIGTDIIRFDLYGPDLVIANKMESGGMEGHINISERTKCLLEELQTINYTFEPNKKISVKSADAEIMSYFVRYTETTPIT